MPQVSQFPCHNALRLTAVLGGQAVDRVVGLGFLAHIAAKGIGAKGVQGTALGINVRNVQLDRGVVLGRDKAVSGRAVREKNRK